MLFMYYKKESLICKKESLICIINKRKLNMYYKA